MSSLPKWNDERAATLVSIVGSDDTVVTADVVEEAAVKLETTTRSIAAKLRNMNYTVESSVKERVKTFSDSEEATLSDFVLANSGVYTYAEIAGALFEGKYTPKMIQGKMLSMDLTVHAKPTPKQEAAKKYSDEEEAVFIKMVKAGAFVEDIAEAMDKSINSVRGKALSLNRQTELPLPKQRESHATNKEDLLEALGDVSDMTVEAIAEKIGKSERGVKTMLTHRKLTASDYDGAKRAAKIADKKTNSAAAA